MVVNNNSHLKVIAKIYSILKFITQNNLKIDVVMKYCKKIAFAKFENWIHTKQFPTMHKSRIINKLEFPKSW